jgi:hypothetical protein
MTSSLRRSDSFLGIHFDHHMRPGCDRVGDHVTPSMVRRIIDAVGPDYIQIDCKGHRGLCSYPTEVGHPAPGFVRDPLRVWRTVTTERGVALFMHYSGVLDEEAVRRHPSWAAVGADGARLDRTTSVFGPYVDKLLLPQLKELTDEYGVDGVWIDGDCWGARFDYSKRALAAFREATGRRSVPKSPDHPDWPAFCEFCREGFRQYLRHVVDSLHEHAPEFQIASNWAFSSIMPERVSADVDFLSGDYSLVNSVNQARWEARVLAPQGMPWDLMAWSFGGRRGEGGGTSTKSIVQLRQEAAQVLALGGGFQAYFKQKADCSIYDWQMTLMADVAEFCRARQRCCHRARQIPQVGLFFNTACHFRHSERPYQPHSPVAMATRGVLNALLDGQSSVEVLMEHHLAERIDEYPLIVVPECDYLAPKMKRLLRGYVRNGGSMLLIGPDAAGSFRKELDIRFAGAAEQATRYIEHDGWLAGVWSSGRRVKLGRRAKAFGRLFAENDVIGPHEPAAMVTKLGKGRIAAMTLELGRRYLNARTSVARDFLGALVHKLFPRPLVEVTGSHRVDVIVNRIDGRLAINLLNTAGPHGDGNVFVYDEVPPVGPLDVLVRLPRKPKKVTVEPGGRRVKTTWSKGELRLTRRRLELHDVILMEE